MPSPLEYIITGALLKCSQGTVPMPFTATPRTSKIAGLLAGNALDKASLVNIPSFVVCQKLTQQAGGTPVPCVPAPTVWQDTYPTGVGGADALLFRSCISCPLGQGKIEFVTSGQLPVPPGTSQQVKETQDAADEAFKQAELEKNSVGEAGLLEGAIPVWGSGRDLIHSIQTGDKVGMALNAAFLVWDVASVVAGVFSFGTATVAMAGAKAGVRTLLKAGTKVALSAARKQMAAVAVKSAALKNGLKGIRSFAAKIPRICVTACCFEHDAVGNLAATTFGDGTRELRLPNAVGNLLSTEKRQDRRYGPAGQLLEAQGTRYGYDAAGNLSHKVTVQGAEWRYAWHAAGHLADVVRPDGGVVRFTYDALGRRVSKAYQGQVTRWVWDGQQPPA